MSNRRAYKRTLAPDYCEVCSYSTFITKHRIKPGRRGGKYVPGNVIALCPNCHAEAELGILTQYELFRIVHARLRRENSNGHYREQPA